MFLPLVNGQVNQNLLSNVFQVLVSTSRVHHTTFCYRPAALPVQHHFLADDMREREAMQEGELEGEGGWRRERREREMRGI